MLVYAVKKYLPTRCGIMTLETPDHGYIYVDMKIYESALMLSSQAFYQTFESAECVVKPSDKPHRETIKRLYDFLPYPLKPLSLLLYWTEQEYDVLSDQIGCLHIISTIIHPYAWLKAPKEQRMQLGPFGPSIRTEYTYEWKAFTESSIDYEKIINPAQSNETHPIFVINAVPGQFPIGAGTPAPTTQANLVSNSDEYSVVIDFDDETDETEDILDEDGKADAKPAAEETPIASYNKLLE